MALKIYRRTSKEIDTHLFKMAFENKPSLVIDCANCANPHILFPEILPEDMPDVYVVEVEMLYKFRDVLKRMKGYISEYKLKSIVITSFRHLFNYGNEQENNEIYRQCWELIMEAGKECDILVSIGKEQEKYLASPP